MIMENKWIEKLKAGNAAYCAGTGNTSTFTDQDRAELTKNGQHPYALIITCGDSRVPPEHIFNEGLGSLFVIRNAGNLIGEFEMASAEYACGHLGVELLVVMGHTHCGAVESTLAGGAEGYVKKITDEIAQAIGSETDARTCEKLNVKNSIRRLNESPVLRRLQDEGKLTVTGAIYDIETGAVTFGV